MTGTREGGLKTAVTNRKRYGRTFYKTIAKMGGSTITENTHKKGFASDPELASKAGRLGGLRSKRKK